MKINPKPKLTRKERLHDKIKRKHDINKYRKWQYHIAADRDNGFCTFCYFLEHKRVPAVDVHHVYGRTRSGKADWREHYQSMLCTCRKCHPPAIHGGPGTNFPLRYVERILVQANQTPINKHFKHEKQGSNYMLRRPGDTTGEQVHQDPQSHDHGQPAPQE